MTDDIVMSVFHGDCNQLRSYITERSQEKTLSAIRREIGAIKGELSCIHSSLGLSEGTRFEMLLSEFAPSNPERYLVDIRVSLGDISAQIEKKMHERENDYLKAKVSRLSEIVKSLDYFDDLCYIIDIHDTMAIALECLTDN